MAATGAGGNRDLVEADHSLSPRKRGKATTLPEVCGVDRVYLLSPRTLLHLVLGSDRNHGELLDAGGIAGNDRNVSCDDYADDATPGPRGLEEAARHQPAGGDERELRGPGGASKHEHVAGRQR